MAPKIPCPNCQEDEWLENNELSYLPQVVKLEDGKYVADAGNGIHVRLWRCNNCMYVMQFWEPDPINFSVPEKLFLLHFLQYIYQRL